MLTKLADLRWWFYSQKQSQGGNMPPTAAAMRPAIQRCHYQCMEWLEILSNIQIFSITIKLWLDNGKQNLSASFLRSSMPCTKICRYGANPELCLNVNLNDTIS